MNLNSIFLSFRILIEYRTRTQKNRKIRVRILIWANILIAIFH